MEFPAGPHRKTVLGGAAMLCVLLPVFLKQDGLLIDLILVSGLVCWYLLSLPTE
jgi:hypothetical protein